MDALQYFKLWPILCCTRAKEKKRSLIKLFYAWWDCGNEHHWDFIADSSLLQTALILLMVFVIIASLVYYLTNKEEKFDDKDPILSEGDSQAA